MFDNGRKVCSTEERGWLGDLVEGGGRRHPARQSCCVGNKRVPGQSPGTRMPPHSPSDAQVHSRSPALEVPTWIQCIFIKDLYWAGGDKKATLLAVPSTLEREEETCAALN